MFETTGGLAPGVMSQHLRWLCFLGTLAGAVVLRAPASNRQILQNLDEVQYALDFRIGGQQLSGLIDTGSFELVVFPQGCHGCYKAAKYDANLSSTHNAGALVTTMSYGSGDTYNGLASDVTEIGPFESHNQTFWEVIEARMPILRKAGFQAIIGIGPPETPSADAFLEAQRTVHNVKRYFEDGRDPPAEVTQTAYDTTHAAIEIHQALNVLDNFNVRTFGICLGSQPLSDGYFIWNDQSPFETPDIFTRIPVLSSHTWSVLLEHVRLTNTGTFTDVSLGCNGKKGCVALMDSGTSLLAVPSSARRRIQEVVTESGADCSNLDTLPSLFFKLGGNMLSLPPDSYVMEDEGAVPSHLQNFIKVREIEMGAGNRSGVKQGCKVLLMESYMDSASGGPLWIFGTPFFRKYYATFQIGQDHTSRALHIAEANDDCIPAETSSFSRKRPHTRHVDLSRLVVPSPLRRGTVFRKVWSNKRNATSTRV